MRHTIILLVLAGAGGLLAACGSSGHPRAQSTAAVRTGATAKASGQPTRAQALAFAHAVILNAADVPGFSVSTEHDTGSAKEKRLERAMLRCAGAPSTGKGAAGPAQGLAQASSKDFNLKRGIVNLGVTSEVSVAKTAALARKELAAIRSARVRECFSHYLDLVFKGQRYGGASIGHVAIQSGTPPAPGMTGSFGWRVTAALTVDRIRIPFYLDFLGFVDGPAEVTLLSSGVPRPFPADAQQRLFSLLLSRARAHRL